MLCNSAKYLKKQSNHYKHGLPAPDFPQGKGESENKGRSLPSDVLDPIARCMLGLDPLINTSESSPGELALIQEANKILGF